MRNPLDSFLEYAPGDHKRNAELGKLPIRSKHAQVFGNQLMQSRKARFRKDQVDDAVIWKWGNKKSVGAAVPISKVSEAVLATAPIHNAETLLASSKGTPLTYDGFASVCQRFRRKLE
ncbi:hypothetical protein AB1E33_27745 [Ruegeria sp. 2012CJ15-1]